MKEDATARMICDLIDENRDLKEKIRELMEIVKSAQSLNSGLETVIEEFVRERVRMEERMRLGRENVRYLFLHQGVSH